MGILGKIVGAGACAIGAGFEAIGRKVEDVFVKREQKNLEHIANYPYAYKYIVREVKEIQENMDYAKDFGLKKNFFGIYSPENEPLYLAYSEGEKFGKCKYTFVDMAANEMAFLVAKKKSCSIECGHIKYELKSSDMFDKRKFNLTNSDYRIVCNDTGSEIKIYGKREKSISIQINKVPSDLGMKWGEYIIGCNERQDVMLTMLLGIAVGTILMQSANLLEAD